MIEQISAFLRHRSTLTLATTGPDGAPAAADLYFAADDALNLYFISEAKAQHVCNITTHAEPVPVAVTVHAPAWEWQEIKGLQLRGICRAVAQAADRARILELYGRKFSFLSAFAAILPRHTLFQIVPHWVRWLDNSVSFGFKWETRLNYQAEETEN